MARRLIISFKNTPEDNKLYEEIQKHSDKSAYVKDVLKGIIEKKIEQSTNILEEKSLNKSEFMDILG
ncbi:hypothetical protein [Clostridium sp. JN-9]|uniref:hypothetical protein n=1 Tax=Clostridium sp. JN-9 TaxID=2507159 RepID=UPI000FFE024C|nr:hypothetical protein [Clostridium sp. JN-9]QAT40812.1 hypothetical protein EQM05_11380 [Clostridium sp. JN-9]